MNETWKDKAGEHGPRATQPLGPMLFGILNAADPAQPPMRFRLQRFGEATIARAHAAGAQAQDGALRVGIADGYASSKHAQLVREGGRWLVADQGSTNGTILDGERLLPGEQKPLRDGALLEVGHTFFFFRTNPSGPSGTAEALDPSRPPPETLNPEWEAGLRKVETLARSGQDLLLTGESGAGKEVLARYIHEQSGLLGAMVSLNCAALPEGLQENELFGHAKGAFSGAQSDRPGLFRAAHGGTLFLDELGDMPPSLQAKLLRVLEDRRVRPLGSEEEVPVELRLVAATHRDLDELVDDGRFRHDLMSRVGLLSIRVPPLRERREDLGLLLRKFLDGAKLEVEALRAICRYEWPLNVRELRKAVAAAAVLARADGTLIQCAHLPQSVTAKRPPQPAPLSPEDEALKARLEQLLAAHGGNISAVAREMKKGRTQIRRWMSRFDLG